MIELTDDSGAYRRILQFFLANQAGVVDPDSGTQNWIQLTLSLILRGPS